MVTNSRCHCAVGSKINAVGVSKEGGDVSPTPLTPAEDSFLRDFASTVQTIIDTFADGGGGGPQAPAAWYPAIQPNNISQAIKVTPGYGQSYPVCGDIRYYETCPDNSTHHARPIFHRCHRPACPSCWKSWSNRAADAAVERIEGYLKVNRIHRDPRHVDVSPPPDAVPFTEPSPEALQWLYQETNRITRILGPKAALPIPHPYRFKNEQKEAEASAAASLLEGVNRYEWALSQPNWADYFRFSPHIHLIASGRLMDSNEFQAKTGWQYHNHDDENPKGRDAAALKGTITYLLSHAWVLGNHKIVRYWFGLSTHNLKRVPEGYSVEPVVCPVCSAACVANPPDIERFDGTTAAAYQDPHNAPPALRKVLHFHYERVRHKPRCPAAAGPPGVFA